METNLTTIATDSQGQIATWLNKLGALYNYLEGAPLGMVVFIGAILVGVFLFKWEGCPNHRVPYILVIGTIVAICVAPKPTTVDWHTWLWRGVFVGLIVGLLSVLISRFLSKKFAKQISPEDTTFISKPEQPQPPST